MKIKIPTPLNKDNNKAVVLIFFIFFFTSFFSKSQDIGPEVVNSIGISNSAANFFVDISIGETAVITLSSSSVIITQGFLQPESVGPCGEFELEFYPNPTKDVITIRLINCPEVLEKVSFFDVFGKHLSDIPVLNQRVNLEPLSSGLYLGKVFTDNDVFAGVIKVVKMQEER